MGEDLALNLESRGYSVSVNNQARHTDSIGFFTDEAAAGEIRTQKNICKTNK